MADKVEFELVSPEKLLVSQPVAMVVMPGLEGYFGVLPGHAPLVASLKAGVIDVYGDAADAVSRRLFVAGGFAQVADGRCTVLVEDAADVADIDRAQAEAIVKDLREDLADAKTDAEKRSLESRLLVAQARLDAVSTAAHPTH